VIFFINNIHCVQKKWESGKSGSIEIEKLDSVRMNIALQLASAGVWKTRIYFVKRDSEEKWCLLKAKSCYNCNSFASWQVNVQTAAKPIGPF